MEKGLLIRELAAMLGVTKDTVINWEVRGMRPRSKSQVSALKEIIPGVKRFLA